MHINIGPWHPKLTFVFYTHCWSFMWCLFLALCIAQFFCSAFCILVHCFHYVWYTQSRIHEAHYWDCGCHVLDTASIYFSCAIDTVYTTYLYLYIYRYTHNVYIYIYIYTYNIHSWYVCFGECRWHDIWCILLFLFLAQASGLLVWHMLLAYFICTYMYIYIWPELFHIMYSTCIFHMWCWYCICHVLLVVHMQFE